MNSMIKPNAQRVEWFLCCGKRQCSLLSISINVDNCRNFRYIFLLNSKVNTRTNINSKTTFIHLTCFWLIFVKDQHFLVIKRIKKNALFWKDLMDMYLARIIFCKWNSNFCAFSVWFSAVTIVQSFKWIIHLVALQIRPIYYAFDS